MARTFHQFDLLIVGGGTAGLQALREARRFTGNVLLINDGPVTTTCIYAGCMPSKSLLHTARLFDSRHRMGEVGIHGHETMRLDIPKAMAQMRSLRKHFLGSLRESLAGLSSYIIDGRARFESPTSVRVDGRLYHAKHIVIATGSSPVVPPAYAALGRKLITSDTLFEQKDLPSRIAVVGMGPLGIESAQCFAMMGLDVTAIHDDSPLGGLHDAGIRNELAKVLREQMTLIASPVTTPGLAGGGVRLKAGGKTVEVDAVFLGIGRKPNLENLGLAKIGIALDEHGMPPHDEETLRITGYPISIAGDALEDHAVLHRAAEDARRVVHHVFGREDELVPQPVFLAIAFSRPNIAVVGDVERAGKSAAHVYGEASFSDQGRAVIEQANAGRMRIYAHRRTRRIAGAEILAPDGEHLAHLLALAIQQGLTVAQMLEMPFYHPTTEEGLRTALRDLQKKLADTKKAA